VTFGHALSPLRRAKDNGPGGPRRMPPPPCWKRPGELISAVTPDTVDGQAMAGAVQWDSGDSRQMSGFWGLSNARRCAVSVRRA